PLLEPDRARRLRALREEPPARCRCWARPALRAGLGRPGGRHLFLDPRRTDRVPPPGRAAAAQRGGAPVLPPGVGTLRAVGCADWRSARAGLRPEPGCLPRLRMAAAKVRLRRSDEGR